MQELMSQIAWPSLRLTQPILAAKLALNSRITSDLHRIQMHLANQSPCRSNSQKHLSEWDCLDLDLNHVGLFTLLLHFRLAASFTLKTILLF